jgi:hypothetical protein
MRGQRAHYSPLPHMVRKHEYLCENYIEKLSEIRKNKESNKVVNNAQLIKFTIRKQACWCVFFLCSFLTVSEHSQIKFVSEGDINLSHYI